MIIGIQAALRTSLCDDCAGDLVIPQPQFQVPRGGFGFIGIGRCIDCSTGRINWHRAAIAAVVPIVAMLASFDHLVGATGQV
jgi:hypothetical protein